MIDLDYYDASAVHLDVPSTVEQVRKYNDVLYGIFRWTLLPRLYEALDLHMLAEVDLRLHGYSASEEFAQRVGLPPSRRTCLPGEFLVLEIPTGEVSMAASSFVVRLGGGLYTFCRDVATGNGVTSPYGAPCAFNLVACGREALLH